MFEHLQKYLNGSNNITGHSLNQGKQFEMMQKIISQKSPIIEGMTTHHTTQPNIANDLDGSEMKNIQNQIDNNSNYNKLLSDCALSTKLYNSELSKGNIDFETVENLRNSMVQTCALMDSTINKFRGDVGNLEKQYNDLGRNVNDNSSPVLEEKLMYIKDVQKKLNSLNSDDETLDGEIDDNELGLNSVYIRYFTWMFASITMTSIVVHQLLKN